jgi:hypothetical protein
MKRLRLLAGVAVLAAALVSLPLMASASSVDTKLQIGFHFTATGPNSASGTFVAAGAVKDSGTGSATFQFSPLGKQADSRVDGIQTLDGAAGSITIRFREIAGPSGVPQIAARGTFEIIAGTGAYAGVKGHGTVLVVADFETGAIIGTEDGQAN